MTEGSKIFSETPYLQSIFPFEPDTFQMMLCTDGAGSHISEQYPDDQRTLPLPLPPTDSVHQPSLL